MAYLILQSKHTRQPQSIVPIDWSNSLTRGLNVVYVPNFASGVLGAYPFTRTLGAGVIKTGNDTSTSGVSTAENTFFVIANLSGLAVDACAFGRARYESPTKGAFIRFSNSSIEINKGDGTNWGYQLYNNVLTAGRNSYAATIIGGASGKVWKNAVELSVSGSGATTISIAAVDSALDIGKSTSPGASTVTGAIDGGIELAIHWTRALSSSEIQRIDANPWQIFALPRRLYFAPSGGGATIITSSGAASLVTKATAAVAATKTTTTVARSAVNGTAAATSIRVGAAAAKATSTGTASTTTIRTATISARATGAGTAAATTMRTGIAAGRLTGSAETTYAAIVSGTFTAAGRTPARGTAAYTSTHAATAAATAATRGTAASTTLRTGIAAARLDARAAVTAAALVAGTVTTSAAAQIGARASVTNTTERVATVAAMLALRGATPAAPELPVIVPPSTRTLSPDHTRLGLSPVAPAKPRLG